MQTEWLIYKSGMEPWVLLPVGSHHLGRPIQMGQLNRLLEVPGGLGRVDHLRHLRRQRRRAFQRRHRQVHFNGDSVDYPQGKRPTEQGRRFLGHLRYGGRLCSGLDNVGD